MNVQQSAPKLKPFGNPITFGILIGCLITIGLGLLISTISFVGIIIGAIGIIVWWAGDTLHPSDPRTAGVLKFWDSYIEMDGKPVVVGGRTILAPYWPIFLASTSIDITNKDKDLPMTVLSNDKVPLEGVISITLRPNIADLVDFIQASGGNMDAIYEQIDDIIYEKAKAYARANTAEDIALNSELISGPLREHLNSNVFEQGSFGVEVIKVQGRFDVPKDVLEAMKQKVKEGYEREGELTEYDTDVIAAERLKKKYADCGENVSLNTCLEQIKTLRLIRDERVVRIETAGTGNTISLIDTKLNMDNGGNSKKRGGK